MVIIKFSKSNTSQNTEFEKTAKTNWVISFETLICQRMKKLYYFLFLYVVWNWVMINLRITLGLCEEMLQMSFTSYKTKNLWNHHMVLFWSNITYILLSIVKFHKKVTAIQKSKWTFNVVSRWFKIYSFALIC